MSSDLAQLKEGMAYQASKYFDTYEITYNHQCTAEQKQDAKRRFEDIVQRYCTKHTLPSDLGERQRGPMGTPLGVCC